MNENNISKILSSYPVGTQLYSPAYGNCLYQGLEANGAIRLKNFLDGNLVMLPGNGIIADGGELMLYPSRNMRDWRKFAWKEGDVLRYSDILVMFGGWVNGDYTQFKAAFECKYGSNLFVGGIIYYTSDFCKATDDVANNFIKKLEDYYGGNLNLDTLEIEKQKQEFKDGDIVAIEETSNRPKAILVYKGTGDIEHCLHRAFYIPIDDYLEIKNDRYFIKSRFLRPATDSEKLQLFDALEKEGKRWNSETKTLEDLPKKCEFKPMDLCLMRGGNEHINSDWTLCQFSHLMKCGKYRAIGGCAYNECIPYNDLTAHLLGTNDDWKGGEE